VDDVCPAINWLLNDFCLLTSNYQLHRNFTHAATKYRNNQLKSMQEELDLSKEQAKNELKPEQEESDKQKECLASENTNNSWPMKLQLHKTTRYMSLIIPKNVYSH
jgi:hypothetical protein